MVPSTIDTDLNDIKGHLIEVLSGKQAELFDRSDRSTRGRKGPTEAKGHVDQLVCLTDRAIDLGQSAEITSDTQQLGLSVTDIES